MVFVINFPYHADLRRSTDSPRENTGKVHLYNQNKYLPLAAMRI